MRYVNRAISQTTVLFLFVLLLFLATYTGIGGKESSAIAAPPQAGGESGKSFAAELEKAQLMSDNSGKVWSYANIALTQIQAGDEVTGLKKI